MVPAILLVLYLWPLTRQIRRTTSKMTISTDKLRYEVGLLGKSTRTIQLPKIQDVRVDQTLAQRMFGVGSISIETAGEASRLTIHNIDMPQAIADEIMARSQHGGAVAAAASLDHSHSMVPGGLCVKSKNTAVMPGTSRSSVLILPSRSSGIRTT